jgi:hypothetical protein
VVLALHCLLALGARRASQQTEYTLTRRGMECVPRYLCAARLDIRAPLRLDGQVRNSRHLAAAEGAFEATQADELSELHDFSAFLLV